MVVESGSRTEAAAPGSPQQGKAGEIERTATQQGEPPPSIAVGVDDDVCRQEPSPLSPPEGLGELRASERDKEWCRPGEKIEAEGASRNDASPCPGGAAPDTEDTGKATPLATAAVHREEKIPPKEEAESTEGLPRDQMSAVALNGRGGPSGGGVEASTAALELQTKARDQAKRLALEVARLRSSLRATTSELNTERSTRVRVEDEWWKKMGEWEEERGSLVASMQEADRRSRLAEQDVERVLAESKAACVAREVAQHKADSVMTHVLNVQDRLVQALQAELTMTNRTREAAQDDARETKKQLRLYVQDFLLWRDRAKRLEARQAGTEAPTPPQHPERDGTAGSATTEASLAPTKGSAEDAGRTQAGGNGEPTHESIPEKYARYFETDAGGYPDSPTDAALFGLQEAEDAKEGPAGATKTDTAEAAAAAAWSTRLAMTGSSSDAARAHFQRSMKAQQVASARLEKDLMKARADLQSIYAGSRTAGVGGGGRAKATSAGLRPGTEEERLGVALPERELDEVDGDEGEGSNDNRSSPESPTGEKERSGGVSTKEENAGESVATHAVEGSHLARVLKVLLGGDPAGGRVSDAPSLSLRLTDFPPTLQAVFGQGPAVTSPAAKTFEHRVTSSKGAHARCGEKLLGQQKRRWARKNPVQIDERELGLAGKAAASENGRVYPAAPATGHAGADGCGRREDRPEQKPHSARGASTVSGVVEGRERCSVTGAFQGYEAKSSLLQRWLDERGSPPLPQPDA